MTAVAIDLLTFAGLLVLAFSPAIFRAAKAAWVSTHCTCVHPAKDHRPPRGCAWCGCRATDIAGATPLVRTRTITDRRDWAHADFRARQGIAMLYTNAIVVELDGDPRLRTAGELRTLMVNAFLAGAESEAGRDWVAQLSAHRAADCALGPNGQHDFALWDGAQCQHCMLTKAELAAASTVRLWKENGE